jgi:hypothetical protein
MTGATVKAVNPGETDDTAPPPGTAIVRPLRHVQAVRDRYLRRFADPAEAAVSRSARAWSWALGENAVSPVTDRVTALPPSRPDIENEIAVADERRLRGHRDNRADAAATILRWLIGRDDHVPVRDDNRGALVGGFSEIVRSPKQIRDVSTLNAERQRLAAASAKDTDATADDRQRTQQECDYLDGISATLLWILGDRSEAPITQSRSRDRTARDLKTERLNAIDVIEGAHRPWMPDRSLPPWYGVGVKKTINWLLGDSAIQPADLSDCRPTT